MPDAVAATSAAPGLQLLRTPALAAAAGAAPQPLHPLSAALLAVLALRGPTSRDELGALLYPQAPHERQLSNLRQRLHQLRRMAPALLDTGHGGVALGAGVRHELVQPEAPLAADPDALPGELLGSFDYAETPELAEWVRRERLAWADRRRDLLARLATGHEAAGRIALALRYATRLVAEEPTHEHGVRLLMRLHYRRGDRGAALAAYERCVQALHQQFGDAVAEETARLADAIARDAAGAPEPLQPMPMGLRHPPRLVARDALLATALRRWEDGRVVLVAGPAGIGKTRLFEALCERTVTTHVVRVGPDDTDAPLGLLRRLLERLGAPRPSSGTPASLTAELRTRLAAQPLRLGIEDLHFADAESLAALASLLPGSGPEGVHWCLTTRLQPLPLALASWLDRHDAHDALLELPEWSREQLAAFIDSLGEPAMHADGWAEALHRHCGGHPLHVLWVLRAVHEQGDWGRAQPPRPLPQPAEMRTRLARRLDGSDAATQQLAFVGALAGADFDAALVARVTGRRAVELAVPWRRLESLGVLQGDGFSHEVVRQAVLDCVPQALRPLLHAEIAQALPDADGVHERRAAHWQAAGRPHEAAADLDRAAGDALRLGLPVRALELLARAERLLAPRGDADTLFDLRWRAARLAILWDSVERALDSARTLLAGARDDRQKALALSLCARARTEQHDAGGLSDAQAACTLAAACRDPGAHVQATLCLASALALADRAADALAALETLDAVSAPRLAAQDQAEAEDLRWMLLASVGRRRDAVAGVLAGMERALAEGHWQRAADLASTAGVHLCYLGEAARGIEVGERCLALHRRSGHDKGSFHVDQMTLAGLYQDAGRFGDAVTTGEAAAAGLRETGHVGWLANADHCLATSFMLLGRFELAERRLAALPDDAPPWTLAAREMHRALLLQRRSGASPLALLDRARAIVADGGGPVPPFVRHRIDTERARWLPPAVALPLLDEAERWARAQQHVALQRAALDRRAQVLLAAGRTADALDAARALEATFAGRWESCNLYLPEVWQTLVRVHDACGDAARADALAAQAAGWIRDRLAAHVPPAFQHGFVHDNRVNRWLLERAAA